MSFSSYFDKHRLHDRDLIVGRCGMVTRERAFGAKRREVDRRAERERDEDMGRVIFGDSGNVLDVG
jgi:hypothetical protein